MVSDKIIWSVASDGLDCKAGLRLGFGWGAALSQAALGMTERGYWSAEGTQGSEVLQGFC